MKPLLLAARGSTWVLNILTSFLLTVGVDNGKLLPFLNRAIPTSFHDLDSLTNHSRFIDISLLLLKLIPRKRRQNTESRKIVTSEFRPRQIVDGKKINEKKSPIFIVYFWRSFLENSFRETVKNILRHRHVLAMVYVFIHLTSRPINERSVILQLHNAMQCNTIKERLIRDNHKLLVYRICRR